MSDTNIEQRVQSLEQQLKRIRALYDKAVLYQRTDPEVALAQARKSAEAICRNVYIHEGLEENSKPASKIMLNDMISTLTRTGTLPAHIGIALETIQKYGNFGTHDQGTDSDNITEDYIQPCLQALATVVHWYLTKYFKDESKASEDGLSQKDQLYLEAVEMALADLRIEPSERNILNQRRAALNISVSRAEELEAIARKKAGIVDGGGSGESASNNNQATNKIELEEWRRILAKKFVRVQTGSFLMGSDNGNASERPVHEVNIAEFQMMKCLVTQREYERVCGVNPSNFLGDGNRPVEGVSWFDAIAFCNKWSQMDGLALVYEITDDMVMCHFQRNGYRLPTEAEWEYACRAGCSADFYWGQNESESSQHAWFDANSEDVTHAVGTKRKNAFGLYDMVGNVWEWTNDWFCPDYYGQCDRENPVGPEFGEFRVLRGGCWFNGTSRLRSFSRLKRLPHLVDDVSGFRCAARYSTIAE